MGEVTKIEWCDHTYNPWLGCTRVTPECDLCYSQNMMEKRYGRVIWGGPGIGNGTRVKTKTFAQPRAWHNKALASGERPFVFCASLADVFDNHPDVEPWRIELFQLIRETPQLVWLLLTKRPQNVRKMVARAGGLPRNVALGASAGMQDTAQRNIPILAALKSELNPEFVFISAEPLLEAVDLRVIPETTDIDWIIVGGESSRQARPMDLQWARDIRDACGDLGPVFNFKQVGARIGHGASTLDGATYYDRPAVAKPRFRVPAGRAA